MPHYMVLHRISHFFHRGPRLLETKLNKFNKVDSEVPFFVDNPVIIVKGIERFMKLNECFTQLNENMKTSLKST